MIEKWLKLMNEVIKKGRDISNLGCPICHENELDYLYVGNEQTRNGYLLMWCNNCLKGIHICVTRVPQNLKFIDFDQDLSELVPKFEIIMKYK